MATKITCDLCDREITSGIKVRIPDGEHPHNGSTMRQDIDACDRCIKEISRSKHKIEIDAELEDLRSLINPVN